MYAPVFALLLLIAPLSAQAAKSKSASPQNLICSPAPCILPNVRVSTGLYPVGSSAVAFNPNNPSQMLIGGEDFNCGSVQGLFSSNDGGSSWTHSCIKTPDGVGEPLVGYDLNNIAYGGGIEDWTAVVLRSSIDNGSTWSNQKFVDEDGLGIYSPWLAVDTGAASQFKNRLYVSSIHGGVYSTGTRIHVSFSADGQHWAGRFLDKWQYPSIDAFPHVSLGEDGIVYVSWLRCKHDFVNCNKSGVPVLLSKSADGGNSWSDPVVVAKVNLVSSDNCFYGCLPNTTAPVSNIPVTTTLGSGPGAKVFVVFYNWTGIQMELEVATSNDGGTTFGTPVRVSNSSFGDQFLPWISSSQTGTLAITWLDRRNDPNNVKYQAFFATSSDGVKFSRSRALTQTLSDPDVSFPVTDFVESLWLGNTLYATWMDTRSGTARTELGGVQFEDLGAPIPVEPRRP